MNPYLIALIIACVADVATTAANLKAGGRELNYLPAALIAKLGVWPVMIGTKALFIALAIMVNVVAFTVSLAALNAAAAAWNWAHRAR